MKRWRALVPLRVKTTLRDRLNQARLERLRRTKRRFRRDGRGSRDAPAGVNLVAYIRADMGLGVVARGMAAAFEAAGISFNVVNLQHGNHSAHTDCSWAHKENPRSRYDVTVVCVNPDNSFHLRTQVAPEILGNRYVIGNWYWELSELPESWADELDITDEVWAASDFVRDAVARRARVPVVRVPPVVQVPPGPRLSRSELGLPAERFLFLAMFDTMSVLPRKNPLGVLRAFTRAFPTDDAAVGLVMKFNHAHDPPPLLQEVRAEVAAQSNVFLIDRAMNREAVASLIDASDCFVSLHRAEGFGLGPAEAMSLGKPAIVTNWSGCTDYMSADNCIAIDYRLVQLGQDHGPYKAHQFWAEPDLDHAACWMKRTAEDRELAARIGSRGRQTITTAFSPEAVGRIIQQRLEQIRGMLEARTSP